MASQSTARLSNGSAVEQMSWEAWVTLAVIVVLVVVAAVVVIPVAWGL
ncbi:MAG: hypothetical protein ACE5PT_08320 [Gemmatimonadales bacterium]